MSRRNWNPVSHNASNGMLRGEFGFETTNIGTDPDPALFWGCGGLTGTDGAGDGSVSNSGPSFVKSITKTANNGEFLVELADGYRRVHYAHAELWAVTTADGESAQVSEPQNEGAGHETPITFLVTTLDNADTPVETTGRKVCVVVALKDSASGA